MTNQEALKRSERSQNLKVFHLEESPWFYVESEEGKICYKVCYNNETDYFCNCGDFARGFKNDSTFKCKHIMAVMNSITEGDSESIHYLERWRPKLDDNFVRQIDDKDFVLYAGLLDVAHQKNLCMVDVELIQYSSDENKNTAICKARVETMDGKRFSDIGDANPQNCNSKVARHLIRMASTRAKARAFRDMDNIGMTALEELGDLNDIIGGDESRKTPQKGSDNVRKFSKQIKSVFKSGNGDGQKVEAIQDQQVKDNVVPMTEKQAPVMEANPADEETRDLKPVETPPAQTKGSIKPNKGNGNGGNGKSKPAASPLMSEAQKSALYNLSRRRGISLEDIGTRSMDKYGVPVEQLTSESAGEFIRYLQAAS
jgi:hypothetical protein